MLHVIMPTGQLVKLRDHQIIQRFVGLFLCQYLADKTGHLILRRK